VSNTKTAQQRHENDNRQDIKRQKHKTNSTKLIGTPNDIKIIIA